MVRVNNLFFLIVLFCFGFVILQSLYGMWNSVVVGIPIWFVLHYLLVNSSAFPTKESASYFRSHQYNFFCFILAAYLLINEDGLPDKERLLSSVIRHGVVICFFVAFYFKWVSKVKVYFKEEMNRIKKEQEEKEEEELKQKMMTTEDSLSQTPEDG